jgi:hypothetical protein
VKVDKVASMMSVYSMNFRVKVDKVNFWSVSFHWQGGIPGERVSSLKLETDYIQNYNIRSFWQREQNIKL